MTDTVCFDWLPPTYLSDYHVEKSLNFQDASVQSCIMKLLWGSDFSDAMPRHGEWRGRVGLWEANTAEVQLRTQNGRSEESRPIVDLTSAAAFVSSSLRIMTQTSDHHRRVSMQKCTFWILAFYILNYY